MKFPFTRNSFWYRYAGTIKAGVNLENAEITLKGNTITITMDKPYVISNTPDMQKSGVLEENNNVFNPIKVEDVTAFERQCKERSESEAPSRTGSCLKRLKQTRRQTSVQCLILHLVINTRSSLSIGNRGVCYEG